MTTASNCVPRVSSNCFPPLQETLLEQQRWLRRPWKISASQDGEARYQITREGQLQLAKLIWTVMWVKTIRLLNEGIIKELKDWNVTNYQEQKCTGFSVKLWKGWWTSWQEIFLTSDNWVGSTGTLVKLSWEVTILFHFLLLPPHLKSTKCF